jgi:hypothetical protein
MEANVWIIGTPAAQPRWVPSQPFAQSGRADVAHQTGINEFQGIAVMMTEPLKGLIARQDHRRGFGNALLRN